MTSTFRHLIASLGGFQLGYSLAIIASMLVFLSAEFSLSPSQEGLLSGALLIGALPGSILAGKSCNSLGRKKVQQLTAFIFFLGSLTLVYAHSLSTLFIGRIIQGIAGGAAAVVGPLYLAEIAPKEKRGTYVSFYQIALAFGILMAYGTGWLFSESQNWRAMCAMGIIPSLLHGFGFHYLLDSTPRETLTTLIQRPPSLFQELKNSKIRFFFFITIFLNAFQQITGIGAILAFTPIIFQNYGFDSPQTALLFTLLGGVVFFLATIKSLTLVDKMGRRPLLLKGIIGMIFFLSCATLSAFFPYKNWFISFALFGYITAFSLTFGPLPQLIISELFPRKLRSQALGVAITTSFLFNFITVSTFLNLSFSFSFSTTFAIYALLGTTAFYFTWKYLPETAESLLD